VPDEQQTGEEATSTSSCGYLLASIVGGVVAAIGYEGAALTPSPSSGPVHLRGDIWSDRTSTTGMLTAVVTSLVCSAMRSRTGVTCRWSEAGPAGASEGPHLAVSPAGRCRPLPAGVAVATRDLGGCY
jgi:hypothetical protein